MDYIFKKIKILYESIKFSINIGMFFGKFMKDKFVLKYIEVTALSHL
ncbi:hypothetical protein DEU42_107111 [Flavobacterium sp. AG291]|nr:hypothetical protein DEU42_107111 [Flavobacterium sp. AG291]